MTYVIRVIDCETTDLDDPAELVEVGWTDIVRVADSWAIAGDRPESLLVNPGMPIGYGAMAAHHIRQHEVDGLAYTPDQARADMVAGADLVAHHNAQFDARFIRADPRRTICTFKCARTVWPDMKSHKNGAIRYELGLCLDDPNAEPSHRAGPDSWITAHILLELLRGRRASELVAISLNPVLLRTVSFGEHFGKPWSEIDEGLLNWVIRKMGDDPKREDEVFTARHELNRRREAGPTVREQQGRF